MVTIGSNRKMEFINQVGPINPMFVEICGGNITDRNLNPLLNGLKASSDLTLQTQ